MENMYAPSQPSTEDPPPSPSFDSAINMNNSDSEKKRSGSHTTPISERLITLLCLLGDSPARRALLQQNSVTVHRYLDNIEIILDSHHGRSFEGTGSRPRILGLGNAAFTQSSRETHDLAGYLRGFNRLEPTAKRLSAILDGLAITNNQLQQRHTESLHLHALFTAKCEALAQRVIELEVELSELQSDMFENTIELEGLRGTVRGLENWIGRWKRERESIEMRREGRSHRKWGWKQRKDLEGYGDENDVLIDGITAWMRGWRDVEEGFRIRAQTRNQRRE